MANIVMTTTGSCVDIDFNNYSQSIGYTKGSFNISDIKVILKEYGRDVVKINMDNRDFAVWYVSYDTQPKTYIIDSINGATPSSIDDLYDKLKELM